MPKVFIFVGLLILTVSMALNPANKPVPPPCNTTADCHSAVPGKGTACTNGICTYATQQLKCKNDADCPHSIPGPEFLCRSGNCEPTGGYLCTKDGQCPSDNGNACVAGKCAFVKEQHELCPASIALLLLFAAGAIFIHSH